MREIASSTRPRARDTFIGRDREMADITSALAAPGAIVSVHGQSGIGKSRLLTQLADRMTHRAVVQLDCEDSPFLEETIARLAAAAGAEQAASRGEVPDLAGRDVVVVLDHADHLRTELPDLLESLTAQDGPRCVVASVLPLPRATASVRLQPLAVPDTPGPTVLTDAMRLFVARVAEVSPGFTTDDETRALIASLVRSLGGVPLALELAAVRHGLLGMPELVRMARAADGLTALAGHSEDRHRSMVTALHWTIEQLEPDQAALLTTLTAFVGDVEPHAIAAVHGGELSQVLDALSALVDLRLVDPVRASPQVRRFRVRDLVASVAKEHCDAATTTELRRRHAGHFADAATRGAALMLDGREADLDRSLPRDLGEIHRAATWLEQQGDIEAALHCAADLACLLGPQAALHQTRPLLRGLLGRVEDSNDIAAARARVAAAACELAVANSPDETHLAMELWKRGAEMVAGQDPRLSLWAHSVRVRALPVTGDFAGAAASAEAGLTLAELIGHPVWQARFEAWSGMVHHQLRDFTRAAELGNRALRRSLATGDRIAQIRVGMLLHQIPAEEWGGNPLLPSLDVLLAHADALDDVDMQRRLLANLILVALRDGDVRTADRWLARLLDQVQPAWGARETASVLMLALMWCAARHRHHDVARLYGAIKPWEDVGLGFAPPTAADRFRRVIATTTRALGRAGFDQAMAEGSGASIDDNLHFARTLLAQLRDTDHPEPETDSAAGDVTLTPRETQVLGHLIEGLRNKEIAERFGTSPKTVMHHTSAIYRKLGVRGRAEAVARALRDGLVTRG